MICGLFGQAMKLAHLIGTGYFPCHSEDQLQHVDFCVDLD